MGNSDVALFFLHQGLNGLPQECKQTVDLTNGHSNHKPVSILFVSTQEAVAHPTYTPLYSTISLPK